MADLETVIKFVNMLNTVAPGDKEISDELMTIYHYDLQDVDDDILQNAAEFHITKPDTAWLPSPGELRQLCREAQVRANRTLLCKEYIAIYDLFLDAKPERKKQLAHLKSCTICQTPKHVPDLPRIPQQIGDVAKQLGG